MLSITVEALTVLRLKNRHQVSSGMAAASLVLARAIAVTVLDFHLRVALLILMYLNDSPLSVPRVVLRIVPGNIRSTCGDPLSSALLAARCPSIHMPFVDMKRIKGHVALALAKMN